MEIYTYSSVTGEFTGSAIANGSPLERGVYLLPANATKTAPPMAGTNEAAVYANGAWSLVPDYRGQRWYQPDGTEVDIDQLSIFPDSTWTQTPPPPTHAQKWAAYQAQAHAALAESDTTMHRIAEGVVAGSTSWTAIDVTAFVQWRRSLRAILSQPQPDAIPSSLPAKPPYPAGT